MRYQITFAAPSWAGSKKINDIRDFRNLTRCPKTNKCATLSFCKEFIEKLYGVGELALIVTEGELARYYHNQYNSETAPDGFFVKRVEFLSGADALTLSEGMNP